MRMLPLLLEAALPGCFAIALGVLAAACSPAGSRSAPAGTSAPATPAPASQLAGEYAVTWVPADGSLQIEGRFRPVPGGRFTMEREVGPYLRELEVAAEPGQGQARWTAVPRVGERFAVPACASAPCRLRYRFALREAAIAFDSLDWAGLHGDLVEAPPSTWLLAPAWQAGAPARLRLRVTTPPGSGFATGLHRTATVDGPAPTWEIELSDLWTTPYSAFGELTSHPLAVAGGTLEVAIGPGVTAVDRDEIVRWVEAGARAVSAYWGQFPMPGALVLLAVTPGPRIGGGRTLSGGGGTVVLSIGATAPRARFTTDWVLVHELVHLGFPSVPRQQTWAQEGIATYVEPFARVRAGTLDERVAWRGLLEGLPNGQPAADDRGLDHTPTWGRIYWGGALFWFLADVELRKRTGNRLGLEHALRGVLAAGGSNASRWALRDVLTAADQAVGVSVLVPQYDAMKDTPHPVALAPLLRELGVALDGDQVIFDDTAPLAAIRRAIAHGSP